MLRITLEPKVWGEHIRRRRRWLDLTQAQLTTRMEAILGRKLSQSTLSAIETGDRTLTLEVAIATASALDIDLGDLLAGRLTHEAIEVSA